MDNKDKQNNTIILAIAVFIIAFVLILNFLSVKISRQQNDIYEFILVIAASVVAGHIPGLIEINGKIRQIAFKATGAIAVLVAGMLFIFYPQKDYETEKKTIGRISGATDGLNVDINSSGIDNKIQNNFYVESEQPMKNDLPDLSIEQEEVCDSFASFKCEKMPELVILNKSNAKLINTEIEYSYILQFFYQKCESNERILLGNVSIVDTRKDGISIIPEPLLHLNNNAAYIQITPYMKLSRAENKTIASTTKWIESNASMFKGTCFNLKPDLEFGTHISYDDINGNHHDRYLKIWGELVSNINKSQWEYLVNTQKNRHIDFEIATDEEFSMELRSKILHAIGK